MSDQPPVQPFTPEAKDMAAGIREGHIRLEVTDPRLDTPEVKAWLAECQKIMAEFLDPAN